MKTYRITPIFLLLFLSASIVVAYLIHRIEGDQKNSATESSSGVTLGVVEVREPANASEEIQEIPREWSERQTR